MPAGLETACMNHAGEAFNLVLGLCAVGYSWLPPHRVKNYRRSFALLLRSMGLLLAGLSTTSVVLQWVGSR